MKCERCDEDITHEEEHYKAVYHDDGSLIHERSGWTCDAKDWRGLYLAAAAKSDKMMEIYKEISDELKHVVVTTEEPTGQPCVDRVRSLLAAITLVHREVDQTDPNCPVGVALTKAGLERNPGVF